MPADFGRFLFSRITDYCDASAGTVHRLSRELGHLSAADRSRALDVLRERIIEHTALLPSSQTAQLAVFVSDNLYKSANVAPLFDQLVADYLDATAFTMMNAIKERAGTVHYVIDNAFNDPQRPTRLFPEWFAHSGFVYICPLEIAATLMEADGMNRERIIDAFPWYSAEARHVAGELVNRAVAEKRHLVYLETDAQTHCRDIFEEASRRPGVIALYRDETPSIGSKIIVKLP